MLNRNCNCGTKLSLIQMLGNGVCRDCQARVDQGLEQALKARNHSLTEHEKKESAERVERAIRGEASDQDVAILKTEGYLFVKKQVISCPICGQIQFKLQPVSIDHHTRTRPATQFDPEFYHKSAFAYTCQNCRYILWFAPEN